MKKIFALATAGLAIFFCESAAAQISIAKYPKQISCETGFIGELPVPQATSACAGEIHTTRNETLASGGCMGVLIVSYIFADDCGNTAEAEQYVTLKDTEQPQLIDLPDDIHIQKSDPVPADPGIRSWDNSNKEFPVIMTETTEGRVITRTWSSTDDCGNTVTASQRIYRD